jgi:outer membrane protein assembly factor BamD
LKSIFQLIISASGARLAVALLLLTLVLGSCSEYSKILKSTNTEEKYTYAVKAYENKEYYKALPILEELIGVTRGTGRAEDVFYYYAKTHLAVEDYYLANYYFKSFTKTFNLSPRAEECQFLAAYCSQEVSPESSLDQTDTKTAIDEYQLFLDKYPTSILRDSANKMITNLNKKLEIKDVDICKQYVKTRQYQAAVARIQRFTQEYPMSEFREELLFLSIQSHYEFAKGSVDSKKIERFRATMDSYITFANLFPNSKYIKDAERIYDNSRSEIEKLTQTPQITNTK